MPGTPLSRNLRCVVRTQNCGRMFASTMSAFVACPGAESVALELEIIKAILERQGLDPYIAIENYDPAKDVFCEKICTRIIESKLCVVLLTDPLLPNGHRSPNPNVYYEYGLMTAFGKPIIPLQRADHELAFNVQSLDTIKYNNFDLKRLFERVLAGTLDSVACDERKSITTGEPIKTLSFYMELQGYGKTGSQVVHGTSFKHFGTTGGKKNQYGIVIRNEEDLAHLRANLTLLGTRLQNVLKNKRKRLEDLRWDASNVQQAGGTQNIREIDRAIGKTQDEIDAIEQHTEFVIVCARSEGMRARIEEEVKKINGPMSLKVRIHTLDELHELVASLGAFELGGDTSESTSQDK